MKLSLHCSHEQKGREGETAKVVGVGTSSDLVHVREYQHGFPRGRVSKEGVEFQSEDGQTAHWAETVALTN